MASKSQRDFTSSNDFNKLKLGLYVDSLNITFSSDEVFEIFGEYFEEQLKKTAKSGIGVITYEGKASEKGTVFLGFCTTLSSYSIRFQKEEGIKFFKALNTDVIQSVTFQPYVSQLKATSFQSTYIVIPPRTVSNAQEFTLALSDAVVNQTRTKPRVQINGASLVIGTKAGSNYVTIEARASSSNILGNLVLTYKTKNQTADKILSVLKDSPTTSLETAIAFSLLELLNSLSGTAFLEYIRTDILRRYQVGSVYSVVAASKNLNSKDGQYVLRSLSGIWNKLTSTSSTEEVKGLIIEWLAESIASQYLIPKGADFVQQVTQLFLKVKASKPAEKASASSKGKKPRKTTVAETQPDQPDPVE